MDPYEEEQEILRENRAHSTPPSSENGDEEPRNADAAEAEPQPCRPGLQPKLNIVLCREASDVAPRVGTFTRAEASLLYEGTTYSWPMSGLEDGFDGSGPFLAARMKACITNAVGDDFKTFPDSLRPDNITGLKTTQPMLKPLPDAPRDHDANASDLVVVTSEGRYLYTNRPLADGTIVPTAYAAREASDALRCSTATMYFRTDVACPCGASSLNHAATARFNATTGIPSISIEHETDNGSFLCKLQPVHGWEASPSDLGRVLQVPTWAEHEVRALQVQHVAEFVAPYETEVAALALSDKTYKVTILVDVLDAKLGSAIVKCGATAKPALFCVHKYKAVGNTRLWGAPCICVHKRAPLPFALKDLESALLPDLDTIDEAGMRTFGQRLGDEDAALEYWKFMKLYFNYEGGVMFRISVIAKALVGDTFLSALYVQLGARKSNGDFIQGAGKGMPSKLDQDALGAYAESCPLSLLFYKEKLDGASPGFAKLEAKRYVLIDEANQQQNQSGGDQVINPNMLRRLVPQGPEVKLSARQLFESHLEFYAQIISLVVNLNSMYAGLMEGRRAQAIHLSTVFLPGDEYDRWVAANHDANVLSTKWRDSVLAVAGADGSAKHNVQRKANGNPYPAEMWKRMASVHLACATLLARRCVKTGAWPAVPKVNEDLTNLLLAIITSMGAFFGGEVLLKGVTRILDYFN